jgi:hypothetical protein
MNSDLVLVVNVGHGAGIGSLGTGSITLSIISISR